MSKAVRLKTYICTYLYTYVQIHAQVRVYNLHCPDYIIYRLECLLLKLQTFRIT